MSVTEICSWTMVGEEGKRRLGGPSASGNWGSSTIRGLDLCLFPPLRGPLLGLGPAFSQDAGPKLWRMEQGSRGQEATLCSSRFDTGLSLIWRGPSSPRLPSPAFLRGQFAQRKQWIFCQGILGVFWPWKGWVCPVWWGYLCGGAGGTYAVDPWERASLEMGKPGY